MCKVWCCIPLWKARECLLESMLSFLRHSLLYLNIFSQWHNLYSTQNSYNYEYIYIFTCIQPPNPWQNSYGWYTFWWVGRQPQSPGLLTGQAEPQTPGCWRSWGCTLINKVPSELLALRTTEMSVDHLMVSYVCMYLLVLTWRDFADGGRMPTITLVAVGTLDKDGTVTQTLCKHLSPNVVQPHAPPWKTNETRLSSVNSKHKLQISCGSYEVKWVPMCLRVSSTAELRFTFDSKPRQKRSELEGSVNPSTVREGWDAWKVSPTRWFSS